MTSCTSINERHHWKMPAAGDIGLTCEICERHLVFDSSEYRTRRRSIVRSIWKRSGKFYAQTFSGRLVDAERVAYPVTGPREAQN